MLKQINITNPWVRPIKNITLGFMCTIMTFSFYGLEHILPVIGLALLFIGFRELRSENKKLEIAYKCSLLMITLHLINLITMTTSINIMDNFIYIKALALSIFKLIFLMYFRSGIKKAFNKGNRKMSCDPILWVIIFNIVIYLIAITGIGGFLPIFIIVIGIYFYMFFKMDNLSCELNGIELTPSKKGEKLGNTMVVVLYGLLCLVVAMGSAAIANHLTLETKTININKGLEVRSELVGVGFPVNIINDMDDKDVLMLEGAVRVESSNELIMFDPSPATISSDYGSHTSFDEPGDYNMEGTAVFIELENGKMFGVEHFKWIDGGAYFNDGFTLTSSQELELINGSLLYKLNGKEEASEIPRLRKDYIEGGRNKAILGAVSYPYNSENQRGYILYEVVLPYTSGWAGNVFLNYTHYNHPFRIPYEEVERRDNMFDDRKKQHGSFFTTKEYDDAKKK